MFPARKIARAKWDAKRNIERWLEEGEISDDAVTGDQRMTLLDDETPANLKDIQLRNGLPPSEALASRDVAVRVELGVKGIRLWPS